jgi:thiol-disulfide isomerase/thioredoxin
MSSTLKYLNINMYYKMNKIVTAILKFLLFLSLVINTVIVSGQQVQFTGLKSISDWENALKTANTSGKKVFLDIYASWCGPCKMMDAKVYADSSVARYFNANFINTKVDGESEFGVVLVRQFKLSAYPTMYFIGGENKLIFTAVGYKDPLTFNNLGKQVIRNGERYLDLSAKFDSNQLNPDERKEYLELLLGFDQKDRYQKVVVESLNNLSEADVLNPANKDMVFNGGGSLDSKVVNIVINNYSNFRNSWGVENFTKYLSGVFNMSMGIAINEKDEARMSKIDDVLIPVYLQDNPAQVIPAKLNARKIFYAETGEWDKYISAVEDYYTKYGDPNKKFFYNEAYYIVSNQISSDKMLLKALEWVNRGMTVFPGFESYFLGTIINAYRKDYAQADIWFEKAKPLAITAENRTSLNELKEYIEKLKTGQTGIQ